jgi:hypothetical protein
MKLITLTLLPCLVAPLVGCVPLPERSDPFAEISAQQRTFSELTLGLVLSENTKKAIVYGQQWESTRPPLGPPMGGDKVFDRVAEVFRNHFKEVKRVESTKEAKALGVDIVAVLDMYMDFPNAHGVGGKATIDLNLLFLSPSDAQIELVRFQAIGDGSIFSSMNPIRDRIAEVTEDLVAKLEKGISESPKLIAFHRTYANKVAGARSNTGSSTATSSDVERLPPASSRVNKHAYGIVVGIERYREKLPAAEFSDRDAKLMGEYLTKVLGYPEENVVVRLNDKAAKTDLEKYFGEWLRNNVEPGGSVFVYYSGHGAPNPKTGDAYLVPYDGDPSFVESTAYPLKQLYASLDKLPTKDIIVVLDSCFSGAGGRSVLAKGARPMGIALEHAVASTGKAVVLAASSGDQISSTYEEKGHGLLTYFFLKGLQGEGDANKDGVIELAELYDYVKPNVQRIARKQYNSEQTPQLLGSPDVLRKGQVRLVERPAP